MWLLLAAHLLIALQPTQGERGHDGVRILAPTPNSRVIVRDRPVVLARGDWQTPDALAVVYSNAWETTVHRICQAALAEMPVYLMADARSVLPEARRWLEGVPDVRGAQLTPCEVDSPWVRDFGPLQKDDSASVWLDAVYSAARPADDAIPRFLGGLVGASVEPLPRTLDGGALIANGAGLCAMTWSSFQLAGLALSNGAELGRFTGLLGCTALAVLPGLTMERTGHADMLAQFVDMRTIMIASVDAAAQPDDDASLQEAGLALEAAARELGTMLRVVRVPMPAVDDGVYRSYVNGTRLGRQYLAPSYDGAALEVEVAAYAALHTAMPGVTLVPIPAEPMIARGGAVHCATLGLVIPRSSR